MNSALVHVPRGRKQSKKSKMRQPPSSLVKVFSDEWSDDWVSVADQLCVYLDLPDLTTRSGLKKVHNELPDIQSRLNQAFKLARRYGNARVLGGVVAIFAKMCIVDAILQDKLVESGFLDRMVALTELPEARHVALRALNALSLHIGKRYRVQILKHTSTLIGLLRQYPDDSAVGSLIIAIFAHSLEDGCTRRAVDTVAIVRAVLESLRRANFSSYMFGHALSLLSSVLVGDLAGCRTIPSFETFLISLMRCSDLRLRIGALDHLLKFNGLSDREKIEVSTTGTVAALNKRTLPADLSAIMDAFGRDHSELFAMKRSHETYLSQLALHTVDPDPVRLGRILATEVLASQYALPELLCDCCGRPRRDKSFPERQKILLECFTALRVAPDKTELDEDLADVLEWKYLCLHDYMKTLEHAQNALARSPDFGYFYYAAAMDCGRPEMLRMVKKGLKCHGLSHWLRTQMLRQAVDAALYLSVRGDEVKDSEERLGLLLSAYADVRELVKLGPPDSLNRQRDLNTYFMIALVVEGPRLTIHSAEIKHALAEIEISARFMDFIGHKSQTSPALTQTRKQIMSMLANPDHLKEWDPVIARVMAMFYPESALMLPEAPVDGESEGLVKWLKRFESKPDDDSDPEHEDEEIHHSAQNVWETISDNRLALLQCTWCGRPSAVLKKCGQCGIARYCDSDCQKRHWKEHKLECSVELLDEEHHY
ncbi:hypothetical protein WOLCODRAFT_141879 [Wolfiporia cocos MD-104 SS10]|uniref:MYND-type domain-containing protein n=1 Tax=Wolfiporia cocos (strain MD-104) TaxID=742152 RepID=A0A2H3IVD3_WOLCO|nr:hypothetical protein WOLCODRAFT_141879 [Wolfiporia cocos MD-104 SS10]